MLTNEDAMRCVICKHSETAPGKVAVTLQRGESIVVIKDVPAEVCSQCGEYYLDDEAARRVMSMGEEAVKHQVEVEILRYAA
jgi:YgiT-type zinc finger domain-containing protein